MTNKINNNKLRVKLTKGKIIATITSNEYKITLKWNKNYSHIIGQMYVLFTPFDYLLNDKICKTRMIK